MTRDDWLYTLPKNLIWAELGVFVGDFSKLIIERCSPSLLYLVDTFPSEMMSGDKDGNNIVYADLTEIPQKLELLHPCVKVIKSTSHDFLLSIKDESLDIVYIDANHSYDAVKLDLDISFRKIKKNGFICGHDYIESDPSYSVNRAVDKFCLENNLCIEFLTKDKCGTFVIKRT
jgi:hypothetical protein